MSNWEQVPELDEAIVSTLVAAVGQDAFAAMKGQFIEDLRALCLAYQAAYEACDEAAAKSTAHALKGAASNIGLARLGALAARLEGGETVDNESLSGVFESSIERLRGAA